MINSHRDDLVRTLALFCRAGTFLDVKVGYQTFLLPPVHFVLQLLLGLRALRRLDDRNLLLTKLADVSVDTLLLPRVPVAVAAELAGREPGAEADLGLLDLYSDIRRHEAWLAARQQPQSGDLRCFLIKDIYRQKRVDVLRYRGLRDAL